MAAPLRYTLDPVKVGDGLWLLRGADEAISASNGGAIANITIMASDVGAILVDAGPSLRFGEALKALALKLTGKPVARVYLTHFHPDHSYGDSAFDPTLVEATAAFRATPLAQHEGFGDGMYRLLGDWMRGTEFHMPGRTAAAGIEVVGGRSLRLLPLAGHSATDLTILDEATGTLIAGDLVFHNRAPSTPHATLATWLASLRTLATLGHRQTIPGHGPFDPTPATAIDQTRDWLTWLAATLRDAVARGLDMVEAGELPIPARFASVKAARYELQRSIAHFYPTLETEYLPRVDKPD